MNDRLYRAFRAHRHLRGFYRDDGETPTERTRRGWVETVERRAKMEVTGRVHILRHTFCSYLAAAKRRTRLQIRSQPTAHWRGIDGAPHVFF